MNLTKQLQKRASDKLLNCDGFIREFWRVFSAFFMLNPQEHKDKVTQKLIFSC